MGRRLTTRSRLSTLRSPRVNALLLAALLGGWGVPSSSVAQNDTSPAIRQLTDDLSHLFAQPANAIWGVYIRSLDHDETLYELNPRTLLEPASTVKIVTLATAAERLGWDYQFETTLFATASAAAGVVTGDLVVRGTGDPTINALDSDLEPFMIWAAELRAAGIDRIDGRIVGDDRAFADDIWTGWGPGWGWDDLGFGFAAPAGALQHHENVTELTIRPADDPGTPATVYVDPLSGLDVRSHVDTGRQDDELTLTLRRLPGPSELVLRGSIPTGWPSLSRSVAVDNPTLFFVTALRQALVNGGIAVHGEAIDIDQLPTEVRPPPPPAFDVLVRHRSAPLSDIAVDLMKNSHNLYAESLLRAVGLVSSNRSVSGGVEIVTDTLTSWGLDDSQFQIVDGSGLSPLNLISAEALVEILRFMHGEPSHRGPFERTLPIAGRDGTLEGRMRGTSASGNAHAKTGTRTGVRALAGYVDTQDGERLGFAILANNFQTGNRNVVRIIDRAVARLADFSRE